jgi:hypothetical protein
MTEVVQKLTEVVDNLRTQSSTEVYVPADVYNALYGLEQPKSSEKVCVQMRGATSRSVVNVMRLVEDFLDFDERTRVLKDDSLRKELYADHVRNRIYEYLRLEMVLLREQMPAGDDEMYRSGEETGAAIFMVLDALDLPVQWTDAAIGAAVDVHGSTSQDLFCFVAVHHDNSRVMRECNKRLGTLWDEFMDWTISERLHSKAPWRTNQLRKMLAGIFALQDYPYVLVVVGFDDENSDESSINERRSRAKSIGVDDLVHSIYLLTNNILALDATRERVRQGGDRRNREAQALNLRMADILCGTDDRNTIMYGAYKFVASEMTIDLFDQKSWVPDEEIFQLQSITNCTACPIAVHHGIPKNTVKILGYDTEVSGEPYTLYSEIDSFKRVSLSTV